MVDSVRNPAVSGTTLVLALALVALGCGGKDEPDSSIPESAAAPISYTAAGGYPAFSSSLEIAADGSARSVSDSFDGPKRVEEFTVPAEELTALRQELTDVDLGSVDVPDGPDCCDLVSYAISYDGAKVEANTVTLPPELDDALAMLQDITPKEREKTPDRPPAR